MLIALGFGWTLGLESQEPLSGQLGKLLAGLHSPGKLLRSALTPSTLLLGIIAAAQLGLLALGRRYEEDFNKFHDFEHAPGLALLGIRLALCALFGWALRRSLRVERQKDVLEFFGDLAFFGAVWFAGVPMLVLFALVLPPYRRHQVVAGGSVLVQVRPARPSPAAGPPRSVRRPSPSPSSDRPLTSRRLSRSCSSPRSSARARSTTRCRACGSSALAAAAAAVASRWEAR